MTHFVSHKGSFCQYLKVKTFSVTDVCLEKDEVKKKFDTKGRVSHGLP